VNWTDGTDNRKRNARIAKKVAKWRRTKKSLTMLLGTALYCPGLTPNTVRALKKHARELPMRHARKIFEHLAVHKRFGYDTVKLRVRKGKENPPNNYTTVYSKLVSRKDVEFWKGILDVFDVVDPRHK
jgi:hypothetical protein